MRILYIIAIILVSNFNSYYYGWNNGHDNGWRHAIAAVFLEIVNVEECVKGWSEGKDECPWFRPPDVVIK